MKKIVYKQNLVSLSGDDLQEPLGSNMVFGSSLRVDHVFAFCGDSWKRTEVVHEIVETLRHLILNITLFRG